MAVVPTPERINVHVHDIDLTQNLYVVTIQLGSVLVVDEKNIGAPLKADGTLDEQKVNEHILKLVETRRNGEYELVHAKRILIDAGSAREDVPGALRTLDHIILLQRGGE